MATGKWVHQYPQARLRQHFNMLAVALSRQRVLTTITGADTVRDKATVLKTRVDGLEIRVNDLETTSKKPAEPKV